MTHSEQLSHWMETVSTHLPHLSRAHARVLALWSFGMILGHSCGLTTVALTVATLLGKSEDAARQQLREWCYAAADKRGTHRQAVEVRGCFAALLRWVLAWWAPEERRLAVVLDATPLKAQFTVLAVSVVYRGCALPVAWCVVEAQQKGAWRPQWLRLLDQLAGSIPSDWMVLVLADRGLYAKWLFTHIQTHGWHPFFRINLGGCYRRTAGDRWQSLCQVVTPGAPTWAGEVICFKDPQGRLPCTLLARWDAPHTTPWLIVTDLAPGQAQVRWYGLRTWIECGFKRLKRGGWQWQQTRMRDPARAERLWLALAVATLWVVSVGGAAEQQLPASSLVALPPQHPARRIATGRSRPRALGLFRRGLLTVRLAVLQGQPLPRGRFQPDAWPQDPGPDPGEQETHANTYP